VESLDREKAEQDARIDAQLKKNDKAGEATETPMSGRKRIMKTDGRMNMDKRID
jgi:hypothetical protein